MSEEIAELEQSVKDAKFEDGKVITEACIGIIERLEGHPAELEGALGRCAEGLRMMDERMDELERRVLKGQTSSEVEMMYAEWMEGWIKICDTIARSFREIKANIMKWKSPEKKGVFTTVSLCELVWMNHSLVERYFVRKAKASAEKDSVRFCNMMNLTAAKVGEEVKLEEET